MRVFNKFLSRYLKNLIGFDELEKRLTDIALQNTRSPLDEILEELPAADSGTTDSSLRMDNPTLFITTETKKIYAEIEKKEKELRKKEDEKYRLIGNPIYIKGILDKYVIGQEQAKVDLSIAFAEMFIRNRVAIDYTRSNILMLGPTGVGKTKLLETLSKVFDMPLEIVKISAMVQEGIVGKTLAQSFKSLNRKMQNRKVEDFCQHEINLDDLFDPTPERPLKFHGIMYIDELDKICQSERYRKNYYGDSLQDELICMMDAGVIHGVDTTKVLFVGGGAFEGIEKLAKNDLYSSSTIGFGSEPQKKVISYLRSVNDDLLVTYGMKKELCGRFSLKTMLFPLSVKNLVHILTRAEDSVLRKTIEFYKAAKNVSFIFAPDALEYIALRAYHQGTGARALNGLVEQILKPYKFNIDNHIGKEIQITADYVKKTI